MRQSFAFCRITASFLGLYQKIQVYSFKGEEPHLVVPAVLGQWVRSFVLREKAGCQDVLVSSGLKCVWFYFF